MERNSVDKAIETTAKFEGSRGYSNVGGDFDGMGLSFGIFQWNAGMHTLQPLLKETLALLGHEKAKEIFTNDDLYVLKKKLESDTGFHQWTKTLSKRDEKGTFRVAEPWYTRFYKLGLTEECQIVQKRHMKGYINEAKGWMTEFGFKSERAFCLFLDVSVQNGSVTGRARTYYNSKAKSNMPEKEKLTLMAEAVAQASNPKWISDVRNRKMTIVEGKGIVHGRKFFTHGLPPDKNAFKLDITDDPASYGEFS